MNSLPESLRNGVRFQCTDCGACCTGAPGRVRVSEEELQAISEFRKEPLEEVLASKTRIVDGHRLLWEQENGDCVFFQEGKCSIHPVKPTQCRLYPFWFQTVRSDAAWEKTCAECPGIGEGALISPEEILEAVQEDLDSGGTV